MSRPRMGEARCRRLGRCSSSGSAGTSKVLQRGGEGVADHVGGVAVLFAVLGGGGEAGGAGGVLGGVCGAGGGAGQDEGFDVAAGAADEEFGGGADHAVAGEGVAAGEPVGEAAQQGAGVDGFAGVGVQVAGEDDFAEAALGGCG
ncbi:hypothetical protein BJF79_36415 [Actinomadura sp. CNU-125]|nr:hypothetical protein BJF79_36415 [Actinomadura sp. CNU-125]